MYQKIERIAHENMSTTKFAMKRKINDKLTVESNSTTKKRRIEERCNVKKEPMNEPDSSVDFNSYVRVVT